MPKTLIPFVQSPYQNRTDLGRLGGTGQRVLRYFKILNWDIKIVRYTLEDNGFREAKENTIDWTVMWYCGSIKTQMYQGLTKYQKVNHFPKSAELWRKDRIWDNMNRMNSIYGDEHFDFVPKTYNLPKEYDGLVDEMEKNPGLWWIVKPSASSQGKGIYFTNKSNLILLSIISIQICYLISIIT